MRAEHAPPVAEVPAPDARLLSDSVHTATARVVHPFLPAGAGGVLCEAASPPPAGVFPELAGSIPPARPSLGAAPVRSPAEDRRGGGASA